MTVIAVPPPEAWAFWKKDLIQEQGSLPSSSGGLSSPPEGIVLPRLQYFLGASVEHLLNKAWKCVGTSLCVQLSLLSKKCTRMLFFSHALEWKPHFPPLCCHRWDHVFFPTLLGEGSSSWDFRLMGYPAMPALWCVQAKWFCSFTLLDNKWCSFFFLMGFYTLGRSKTRNCVLMLNQNKLLLFLR